MMASTQEPLSEDSQDSEVITEGESPPFLPEVHKTSMYGLMIKSWLLLAF